MAQTAKHRGMTEDFIVNHFKFTHTIIGIGLFVNRIKRKHKGAVILCVQ